MKLKTLIGIAVGALLVGVAMEMAWGCATCGCSAPKPAPVVAKEDVVKPQTLCPVMGGKVTDEYVDVKGVRVYVCCPGCVGKIKADPDKYLAKIRANGETPTPLLCGKCGEIKGTAKCCLKEATRCGCGAIKGAPGCCKLPEEGKNTPLCVKCGQIKGTEVCCDKKAPRCDDCGLAKGSPGCCKIK